MKKIHECNGWCNNFIHWVLQEIFPLQANFPSSCTLWPAAFNCFFFRVWMSPVFPKLSKLSGEESTKYSPTNFQELRHGRVNGRKTL